MTRLAVAPALLALVLAGACAERAPRSVEREAAPKPTTPPPPSAPVTPPPAIRADDATRTLAIPARAQAPESPLSGWCGETAIQEGLLHLGVWAPQRLINKAGRPSHPDLYSPDIPVALTELGVRHSFYPGPRGFDAFASWARAALDDGDPVLAGVKILPTEHPEWGLDHFVLVVGHGSRGLLVNTTWGTRVWVGDTRTPGLSLTNAFYGIRLTGLALPKGALRARVSLVEERADGVTLRASCEGVLPNARVRMERRTARAEERPVWSEELVAVSDRVTKELTVEPDRPSRFHCVPLEARPRD
jgi:hypothetical protein